MYSRQLTIAVRKKSVTPNKVIANLMLVVLAVLKTKCIIRPPFGWFIVF